MDEFLKAIGGVAGSLGLDIVLILGIVIATYFARVIFKPKKDSTPMIYALAIGIVIGIAQIVIGKIDATYWLRTALGYPIAGIFAYMIYRKQFPDSDFLKPPEAKP
jgi:Ca2+/Na+ antiporter